jgi:hypothetical protein
MFEVMCEEQQRKHKRERVDWWIREGNNRFAMNRQIV